MREHDDVIVDILVMSRVPGNPASILAGGEERRLRMDLASEPGSEIRRLRSLGTTRDYDRVVYLAFSGETALSKLKKLLALRLIVGPSVPLSGFRRYASTASLVCHRQWNTRPMHQSAAPFTVCPIRTPTREEIHRALHVTPDDDRRAADVLGPLKDASPVALYIGAKVGHKQWPLERYQVVAQSLLAAGRSIVFIGGTMDHESAETMRRSLDSARAINACGIGGLGTTIAVLRRCAVACGTDGSPMHMAGLSGTKTVALFCNLEPAGLWEPTMAPCSVSLRPGDSVPEGGTAAAMLAIHTDHVLAAIDAVATLAPGQHQIWNAERDGTYRVQHAPAGPIAEAP
jgi:hypothetical protein